MTPSMTPPTRPTWPPLRTGTAGTLASWPPRGCSLTWIQGSRQGCSLTWIQGSGQVWSAARALYTSDIPT
jgi:hypothetical protein